MAGQIQMPHTWDDVFERNRGEVPLSLVRAISYLESGFKADAKNPGSSATGLFQVMSATRDDYNRRYGTNYVQEDLKQPEIAARIGIELLRHIADSLVSHHPQTVVRNWKDPRFASYVVMGFVNGWTESTGVGRLIGILESTGMEPTAITVDALNDKAQDLDFPDYWNDNTLKHVKNIITLYMRDDAEMTAPENAALAAASYSGDSDGKGKKIAIAGGVGIALAALLKWIFG